MMLIQSMNKVWAKANLWRVISRQRRQLSELSDHLPKDIGFSRIDVEREANRPFWDYTPCNDASLRKRGGKHPG